MVDEIAALTEEYDQKTVLRHYDVAEQLGNDAHETLVKRWQAKDPDNRKSIVPKDTQLPKLSVVDAAKIMRKYLNFCLFSDSENERLAMYLPTEGIYTQNYLAIKKYINAMYPPFTKRDADEVIYQLIMNAPIKSPLNDKNLIPVANGVWNIKQKQLLDFDSDMVFTTKIATRLIDNPTPPNIEGWTFDSWLNEIANGDEQIVKLLWQVIADSLNGNYTRKKAIFLYSQQGSSGKGTFQTLIQNLVGMNNVGSLKVNQFDERFRLAMLVGKTVCIGDDIAPDIYIKDSSNFNSVVTGDLVSIEFKGRDSFTTQLRCTVIQSCNGLPNFHNKQGTLRRIVIVPFNNHFEGTDDNWKIKSDYLKRADVLEYVLYQALQLDFEEFDVPEASSAALKEFEQDNDPLIGFKKDFFEPLEISKVPTYYLYEYYKKYCKVNNLKELGNNKFTRRFAQMLPDYEKSKAKLTLEDLNSLKQVQGQNEIYAYAAEPEQGKTYNCFIKR